MTDQTGLPGPSDWAPDSTMALSVPWLGRSSGDAPGDTEDTDAADVADRDEPSAVDEHEAFGSDAPDAEAAGEDTDPREFDPLFGPLSDITDNSEMTGVWDPGSWHGFDVAGPEEQGDDAAVRGHVHGGLPDGMTAGLMSVIDGAAPDTDPNPETRDAPGVPAGGFAPPDTAGDAAAGRAGAAWGAAGPGPREGYYVPAPAFADDTARLRAIAPEELPGEPAYPPDASARLDQLDQFTPGQFPVAGPEERDVAEPEAAPQAPQATPAPAAPPLSPEGSAELTGPLPEESLPEGPLPEEEALHGPDSEPDGPPPLLADGEQPTASYTLLVNGVERPVSEGWIGESLLFVLRERLGLAGAKNGCDQGECGACSVRVDGRLVAACLVSAALSSGSEIETVEGMSHDGEPSAVQQALASCSAVQCGYCIPGMAMAARDLLDRNPDPTDLDTREALAGNLCRCTGYRGARAAVRAVAEQRAEQQAEQRAGRGHAQGPPAPGEDLR